MILTVDEVYIVKNENIGTYYIASLESIPTNPMDWCLFRGIGDNHVYHLLNQNINQTVDVFEDDYLKKKFGSDLEFYDEIIDNFNEIWTVIGYNSHAKGYYVVNDKELVEFKLADDFNKEYWRA